MKLPLQPKAPSEVGASLDDLRRSVVELNGLLDELSDRLLPVLSESIDKDGPEEKLKPSYMTVPLASDIGLEVEKVREENKRLRNLINRLGV